MDLIIILCLCVIATLKVTIQGHFAKKNVILKGLGIYLPGPIFDSLFWIRLRSEEANIGYA